MKNFLQCSIKLITNILIIFPVFVITIKTKVMSEDTYDPCAYVGASNNPDLPQFCLDTDSNCCYFAFQWNNLEHNYVYYTCINKQRLLDSVKQKNMTAAFIVESSDDVYPVLRNIMYVECADQEGVIVSPKKMKIPTLDYSQRRILSFQSFDEFLDNNNNNNSFNLKNLVRKISDVFIYFINFIKYCIENIV